MKKIKSNIGKQILIPVALLLLLGGFKTNLAQDIRWLHVTNLQSPVNEIGSEYEGEFTSMQNTNYMAWPAMYGLEQNIMRMIGFWIGCKDFNDPVEGKLKSVKVIGSGPRDFTDRVNQIFPVEIKLIAKRPHPQVLVDDQIGTLNATYDVVDSIDENMAADRMVVVKFNTSIGVTVVKKVMVFDTPNDGSYFINDYTMTNTGIYNAAGSIKQQTLQDVYFYWIYRYAFAGESVVDAGSTWGAFASAWGASTLNHDFGLYNPTYQPSGYPNMRGFYSYYGPSKDRTVTYDEDWGCPDEAEDGKMGSYKYSGCVTLHVDKSTSNNSDDPAQPKTTWFIASDIAAVSASVSQYDESFMADRYTIMSEGHPDRPHDVVVGNDYAINLTDARRQAGGGTSQGQGYGPYTMAPGESVHIVFAFGCSGLSREKELEVGSNWVQYYKGTGTPTLTLPDGTNAPKSLDGANTYKREWVQTGKDSLIKIFNNAVENYNAGYNIALPPPPPDQFIVTSGGDRIALSWSDNADSDPHFNGYVIYRSEGNVTNYLTKYIKIFECGKADVVHSYDDKSAHRGSDYYYYIQSKDDGTQNDVEPGKPLYSSPVWTVTSQPATLQRPAGNFLSELRVVPNPYDIRARFFQFGDKSQYDRIAVYGLPAKCNMKVYTERGDLIYEKDHTRGTGDELWDSQTMAGQIIASGIYILYIEVSEDIYALEDTYATHDILDDDLNVMYRNGDLLYHAGDLIFRKGESKFRKFVIIR